MKGLLKFYITFFCLMQLVLVPRGAGAEEIQAITRPSADIDLSFVQPGKIHEVLVKEGSYVKKGDLLARQEDDVERIQYQILSAQAEDTTQIAIAQADLLQKGKDLEKIQWALNKGAATVWEVDHARLLVVTAELTLKLAKFENKQNILKQQEYKAILDNLHLLSPSDGLVEYINVEAGETVQAFVPLVRVVNIAPLLIEVAVPRDAAQKLSRDQKATVKCADGTVLDGTIKNISSVADAAANTLRVQVVVANQTKRPAGERVFVTFVNQEK